MQSADIKIRISKLSKSFEGKSVLRGLDLEVPTGKSTVLIGGAASGKSVLMKCILGLYPIDGGSIEIDGRDLADMSASERLALTDKEGVLLQQNGLFDSLPVWENIAFKLLNVRGLRAEEAREIALEKLGQVGLAARVADLFPSDLSGGMQKRVGLARAFADDPEILLLDNPTAGLDPIMTNEINRLVQTAVAKLGATVLAITSDMKAAQRYYDRLAMLHDGRIIWQGAADEAAAADNPYLDQLIHGRSQGPIGTAPRAVAS
ncbi:MAG TPA: ATP-binding cassette domain-containing protein [Kiloniellaceae bacterium]|nr:ATP-binding cassette domain-containing protein [Kiloniellaceae bacterium]